MTTDRAIEVLMGGNIDGIGLRVRPARVAYFGWWIAAVALALGIFALCFRPVMRLKSQHPAWFADTSKDWDATRRAREARAANAYWQLAMNGVQWQYHYGQELPENAAAEFKLEEKDFAPGGYEASPATRMRYWRKLHEVWRMPDNWNKTYVWNPGWLAEAFTNFTQAAWRFTTNLTSRLSS